MVILNMKVNLLMENMEENDKNINEKNNLYYKILYKCIINLIIIIFLYNAD